MLVKGHMRQQEHLMLETNSGETQTAENKQISKASPNLLTHLTKGVASRLVNKMVGDHNKTTR